MSKRRLRGRTYEPCLLPSAAARYVGGGRLQRRGRYYVRRLRRRYGRAGRGGTTNKQTNKQADRQTDRQCSNYN
jgi:hypothetical protein